MLSIVTPPRLSLFSSSYQENKPCIWKWLHLSQFCLQTFSVINEFLRWFFFKLFGESLSLFYFVNIEIFRLYIWPNSLLLLPLVYHFHAKLKEKKSRLTKKRLSLKWCYKKCGMHLLCESQKDYCSRKNPLTTLYASFSRVTQQWFSFIRSSKQGWKHQV